MSFIYALFISSTLAIDLPDDSFNHVKFDFFYKAIFVPQNESERPRVPMNALMPVIIPTLDYRLIRKTPIENGDLDYLIWMFNRTDNANLEALCLYRKLLQPDQFSIENLMLFKGAVSNMMPEPRYDLMLLAEMSIKKLETLQSNHNMLGSSDDDNLLEILDYD